MVGIAQEIGNSWHAIKIEGTKNPIGVENISIINRFLTSIL